MKSKGHPHRMPFFFQRKALAPEEAPDTTMATMRFL